MNGLSFWMLLSSLFVVIGIVALCCCHETISTRKSTTQLLVVLVMFGGLAGLKGNYAVGILISVLALIAYFIRWRRFKKEQHFYCLHGLPMPDYKKP